MMMDRQTDMVKQMGAFFLQIYHKRGQREGKSKEK
jgi:hypothetical protein